MIAYIHEGIYAVLVLTSAGLYYKMRKTLKQVQNCLAQTSAHTDAAKTSADAAKAHADSFTTKYTVKPRYCVNCNRLVARYSVDGICASCEPEGVK